MATFFFSKNSNLGQIFRGSPDFLIYKVRGSEPSQEIFDPGPLVALLMGVLRGLEPF